ncbi:MAG: molecular chaperone TorD family protein [Desulfotignum sp.]
MNCLQIGEIEPEDRAFLFHVLSQLLDYPDMDLIHQIRDPAFIENLESVLQKAGIGDEAASLCAALTLSDGTGDGDEDLCSLVTECQKEYTHLCFASKPRLVHLFESVYRTGKLMQDCTFDIARLYYDAGLRVNDGFDLLPDHIALEMEFMSYLSLQEAQALSANDITKTAYAQDLQEKVLTHHLMFFAARLSKALQTHGRSRFYQAVGRVVGHLFDDRVIFPDLQSGRTTSVRDDIPL